jgi:hypothetical protein
MTESSLNHGGLLGDDPESPSMTAELLAEPGLAEVILTADLRVAAGEYCTLYELRNALEARQHGDDAE